MIRVTQKVSITYIKSVQCGRHLWHAKHLASNSFSLTLRLDARRAGSDGNMPASGSEGPGFDPQQGNKFSFENFQPRG